VSTIDETLKANEAFARQFPYTDLPIPPARRLAIVACMDARLDVEEVLGLQIGDAHVIRNAGGIVTEDALRSLIISHHLLGTQEFMIINHTDCGMQTFTDGQLKQNLQEKTGKTAIIPSAFHAFADLEKNVREQIAKVQSHPWLPNDVPVRGFIYDVLDGKLHEVKGE
jgi:carbonic anhydrase